MRSEISTWENVSMYCIWMDIFLPYNSGLFCNNMPTYSIKEIIPKCCIGIMSAVAEYTITRAFWNTVQLSEIILLCLDKSKICSKQEEFLVTLIK